MKVLSAWFLLLATSIASAQSLPTPDEIFTALYGSHYNPSTKQATWHCPEEKAADPDGCVFKDGPSSEVDLLQVVLIKSEDLSRVFVVTSAPGHLDCHACAPLMGFGVFLFHDGRWELESKNVAVRFGSSGHPGEVDLVKIGPNLYGFMLTNSDIHQGYVATVALLLAPVDKGIQEVWNGMLDEDNEGAYDPTGKDGPAQRAHVDAAYRLLPDGEADHYMLQVISHGYGYGRGSTYHSRSLVANYRFVNGRYEQVRKSTKQPVHVPRP